MAHIEKYRKDCIKRLEISVPRFEIEWKDAKKRLENLKSGNLHC